MTYIKVMHLPVTHVHTHTHTNKHIYILSASRCKSQGSNMAHILVAGILLYKSQLLVKGCLNMCNFMSRYLVML